MNIHEYSSRPRGRFHRQGVAVLAAACALAFWGSGIVGLPARAQEGDEGKVAVGGKTILIIRTPSEGMTIAERAEAVQNRLVLILADPDLKPSDITAVPLGRNAAKIMVKNRLLVTVDTQTARLNQAKPLALAQTWVSHLQEVLPKVNQQPNPNEGAPVGDGSAGPSPR